MGKIEDDNREVEEVESFSSDCEEDEAESEKCIKHYSTSQRILLVGEGDFSFSLSLAKAFGSAQNMVATSLDTQESLAKKYSNGIENVRQLEARSCLVLHGVDATLMSNHFFLRTQRFDRIVYNFPHVGFHYKENSYCQIQVEFDIQVPEPQLLSLCKVITYHGTCPFSVGWLNKRLVKGFLKNAKKLLKEEKGEIHISHKDGDPYNKWDLVKKAEKIGLVLQDSVPFHKDDYPGYQNKRAHGSSADAAFPLGDCTTFMFRLKSSNS